MTVSGPALYLLGETLFRLRMIGSVNSNRVTTVLALCLLGLVGSRLSALALSGSVAGLVTALALWEYEPSPSRAEGETAGKASA